MYDLKDEDIGNAVDISQPSTTARAPPLETQLPTIELLKVCILVLLCINVVIVNWLSFIPL